MAAPSMLSRTTLSAVAVAVFACTILAGCGDRTRQRLSRMRASCVVVLLDAAAAGHFGTYGYHRDTTPHVDALAGEGVVFEHAQSQASSTSISVPSFFSGFYPHTIARKQAKNLLYRPPFLAELFQAAGFRTTGFSESPFVGGIISNQNGFQEFSSRKAPSGSQPLVEDAIKWLRANHQSRFYMYLHVLRPHNPYIAPPDIAERFRPPSYRGTLVADTDFLVDVDLGRRRLTSEELAVVISQYDANLFYGDQLVGQLVRALAELGALERTVIIVIADHGEAFGQHGQMLHNTTVYQEMLRVPFVIRFPKGIPLRGRRVSQPVGLVDLVPTLADLFSLSEQPLPTDGVSLLPAMQDPAAPPRQRPIFSQAGRLVSALDGPFKYIVTLPPEPGGPPQREELYFLPSDPEERRDVRTIHEERTRALRMAVAKAVDPRAPQPSLESTLKGLSEDTLRELRALGYVQ